MTNKFLKTVFAFSVAAASACAQPNTAELPEVDCSKIDLEEKAGFSTVIEDERGSMCYRITADAGDLYEFAGFCKPKEGTFQFYRHFAGRDKGGMEADYHSSYSGIPAIISLGRTPSGYITFPSGIRIPEEEAEQIFRNGAEVLDSMKKSPQVCRELLEYKDNASKH